MAEPGFRTEETGSRIHPRVRQKTHGFTVPYRRWVAERIFAWVSRCRRLAKDCERSLDITLAWTRLAACRFTMRWAEMVATC